MANRTACGGTASFADTPFPDVVVRLADNGVTSYNRGLVTRRAKAADRSAADRRNKHPDFRFYGRAG